MTLQECYAALGGDYAGVLSRLRSERLIQKFLLKFLEDDSYDQLCRAMQQQNHQEAFRAAHTIKGICLNFGFTTLLQSSSALTDSLRNGWSPESIPLAEQVTCDYQRTINAIQAFRQGVNAEPH